MGAEQNGVLDARAVVGLVAAQVRVRGSLTRDSAAWTCLAALPLTVWRALIAVAGAEAAVRAFGPVRR